MKRQPVAKYILLQMVVTLLISLNAQEISVGGGIGINSKIESEFISKVNSDSYFNEELGDFTNFLLESRIRFEYGITHIVGMRYQYNSGDFVLENVPYSNRKTTFSFIEPLYSISFRINQHIDINPGLFFGIGKVDDNLKYWDHTIFELRNNSWSPSFGFQVEASLRPISSIQILPQIGFRWFDQDPFMTDNAYQLQREDPPHTRIGDTDLIEGLYFYDNRNHYTYDNWYFNLQVLLALPFGK